MESSKEKLRAFNIFQVIPLKQQISGTAIGTKRIPTYVCIFIDEFENEFLRFVSNKPLV